MLFKTAISCISGLRFKVKQLLLIFILILFTCGFSDIKQKDEYTCGPVCAANCVINILSRSDSPQKLVKHFIKSAKTSKKGTTAQKLIKSIEIYLAKNHIKTDIKYYGIRHVEKNYQSPVPIDICDELQRGSSIILNLGFYSYKNGIFKRNGGHYVNANSCDGKKILISDPYAKHSSPFYIQLKSKPAGRISNPIDNEKYNSIDYEYFAISPDFDYLNPSEIVFLNGIIKIYPLYL